MPTTGVGEYWIIDTEKQLVEQYVLADGSYELQMKGSSGDLVSVVIDAFVIPVKAIFDSDTNLATLKLILR